ncbi:uncharacterized protein LOC110048220 isoform X3 [Orbicella faveolata]|uniref:uncharacterized protein LOC110048220 isoform X3 n=1 Tax=Orbicella faveolata TaxID=48498 RepID=UPI0009E4276F|nr:uncharacterized protein LOC110048220 isoform X3 [Orbicella faveolata]
MIYRREAFVLSTSICVFALFQASCQSSLSLTEDRPPDLVKVPELGKDVPVSWGFSYKDSASISNGPWEAQAVLEISFGIWKSINDRILLKKIVAVDKSGKFQVRSGYESKIDWSYSVNKLTFKLKSFAVQDEATYGINVELIGLDQKSLTDTVSVETAAQYNRQTGNLTVRNETAYTSETVDLLFKRSAYDKTDDFFKYRIYKGHVSVITLGKVQDGKHGACVNDSLLAQCQQRYSLRYVNKTYVSFRLSNVTLLDSGLYTLQAFFAKIIHDPEYAELYLTVQEKPSTLTSVEPAHETSNPTAKGGQSDVQFSIISLLVLMIFQALFHKGVVTC